MAKLCYVTTCMGRLAHLQQSLPRIAGQQDVECVVVDYACPEGAADWVAAHHSEVRVVRVEGETHFNASKARNAGAKAAKAPWLAFFDADVLLAPGFTQAVVPGLAPGYFYRADPLSAQTWGSVICHRDDFRAVGGYDEAYAGWGGEDDDLVAMLRMAGRRPATFPARLLGEIAHSEEERVRRFELKDRRLQNRINQLYHRIKVDMMLLQGRSLSEAERRGLYDEVARVSALANQSAGSLPTAVQVGLPDLGFGTPPGTGPAQLARVQRRLTYTVTVENPPGVTEQPKDL